MENELEFEDILPKIRKAQCQWHYNAPRLVTNFTAQPFLILGHREYRAFRKWGIETCGPHSAPNYSGAILPRFLDMPVVEACTASLIAIGESI